MQCSGSSKHPSHQTEGSDSRCPHTWREAFATTILPWLHNVPNVKWGLGKCPTHSAFGSGSVSFFSSFSLPFFSFSFFIFHFSFVFSPGWSLSLCAALQHHVKHRNKRRKRGARHASLPSALPYFPPQLHNAWTGKGSREGNRTVTQMLWASDGQRQSCFLDSPCCRVTLPSCFLTLFQGPIPLR